MDGMNSLLLGLRVGYTLDDHTPQKRRNPRGRFSAKESGSTERGGMSGQGWVMGCTNKRVDCTGELKLEGLCYNTW